MPLDERTSRVRSVSGRCVKFVRSSVAPYPSSHRRFRSRTNVPSNRTRFSIASVPRMHCVHRLHSLRIASCSGAGSKRGQWAIDVLSRVVFLRRNSGRNRDPTCKPRFIRAKTLSSLNDSVELHQECTRSPARRSAFRFAKPGHGQLECGRKWQLAVR